MKKIRVTEKSIYIDNVYNPFWIGPSKKKPTIFITNALK